MEGHADNVAAALMGGFVVTFTRGDGTRCRGAQALAEDDSPDRGHAEREAGNKKIARRAAANVSRADAVHNLQRTALFVAALEERRYELLWDAMQDRLHQTARQSLIPGLAEALAMPRMPGLLGVALSGAGPSVIALATDRFDEIGKAIARCFEKHGLAPTVRHLEAAQEGLASTQKYGPLK